MAVSDVLKQNRGYSAMRQTPNPPPAQPASDPYSTPGTPWYIDPNSAMQNNPGYSDLIHTGVAGVTAQTDQSKLQGYGSQFASMLKNMTGQDPTADDFNKFYGDIVKNNIIGGGKGINATNYADVQNLVNPYLQNQYGKQIGDYQNQQQQQHTQDAMGQAQGIVDTMNQNSLKNLTSPGSLQRFGQSMNQGGMLNSGAYQTQLADQMAAMANNNQNSALQQVGLPGVSGQMQTQNAPYQQFLGNMNQNLQGFGQGAQSQFDFGQNSQLMQQLQRMMEPSKLQQWAPIISGALQGGGSALSGAFHF